ncbi:MAG: rhomboid family intramembrane serine protease [Thermoprotei archaeon]|nr:MAG: rhomboid family intramembrane serine protease [Thermoprotei archaeon]
MEIRRGFLEEAPVTVMLIVLNMFIYIILGAVSGNFLVISSRVLMIFGQFNIAVMRYSWWWQLVTSLFVHLNLMHLLLNMFWLLVIGVNFEKTLGSKFFTLTYFISGLTGNIASLIVDSIIFGPYYPIISAGASGAILGAATALATVSSIQTGNPGKAVAYIVFLFLLNSIAGNVDIMGHLGGILGGALTGLIYAKLHKPPATREEILYI